MILNPVAIKNKLQKLFRTASISFLSIFILILFLSVAGLYYLTSTLPDVSKLKGFQHVRATEVFSDEGKKIGEFTTERRYPFSFESLPKYVIQAFLAAEDAKFYEHNGVDFAGIGRAVFSNVARGKFAQGGSTITQQVARALLLETKKKEITRKIREIVLAWRMEKKLSKNEILNLYLNEIFLGHGSYGVASAARNYFGKKVEELTLGEASMLAGLPQRPNEWNPIKNPKQAKLRQRYVLKRMVDEKFVSQAQSEAAYSEVLRLRNLEDLNNSAAPYFTEYVRSYLMSKYGSEQILSQGYRVYTTVKYDFQKAAERAVDRGVREVDKRLGWRGKDVVEHLEDPSKQELFIRNSHKIVVEDLNPPRLLYPEVATGARGLEYDLTPYYDKNSRYFGLTPVSEGQLYQALVSEVRDDKQAAFVRIGQTALALPLASAQWVKLDGIPIKQISQILKQGDVIWVRVDKIDKRANYASVTLEQEPEVQGALLSYEVQNGFVRAMVGGTDFRKSKFNCALQAKRQVGSTFKPLLYAAAFDKGFSPASMVTDSPIVFKTEGKAETQTLGTGSNDEEWKPHNYGNKFEGDIPLRTAIIRSMNIPTVKLLSEIGVEYAIQYARTLGITSQLPRDLTIGLGSWSSSLEELMRAYAIFPRLGKPVGLRYIKRVEDSEGRVIEAFSDVTESPNGNSDPILKSVLGSEPKNESKTEVAAGTNGGAELPPGNVISAQTAYVMTDVLKGVIRDPQGTGHAAGVIPRQIAGKTGTSNDHRDAWFVGYTPTVMSGVWVGYLKDKPLDVAETGGKAAAPIWADYMKVATAQTPNIDFSIPDDVVFAYIDRNTGKLAGPGTHNRVRVAFKVGTVPNSNGDNILRVSEPGVRKTATGGTPSGNPTENGGMVEPSKPQAVESETSDFIRQEFQ